MMISPSRRGTLLTTRYPCRRHCRQEEEQDDAPPDAVFILIVAFRRPPVKNAFNNAMYLDLIDVLHDAEQDDSIAAVVLTGTGSYFSSGADLKETSELLLSTMMNQDDDHDNQPTTNINNNNNNSTSNNSTAMMLHRPPGQCMMAMLEFPKVLVAAVNGPAVGIAVTLLFHCDIVVCCPTATFWTPFTRLALGTCVCCVLYVNVCIQSPLIYEMRCPHAFLLLFFMNSSRIWFVRDHATDHGIEQGQRNAIAGQED
jgi:peroxisomal 3,2-trans-enoyl-CoA isomerase